MSNKLPASVLEFDDFLNEPSEFEDVTKVREYRHQAYPKWQRVVAEFRASLSSAPQVTDEAVEKALAIWFSGDRTCVYLNARLRYDMRRVLEQFAPSASVEDAVKAERETCAATVLNLQDGSDDRSWNLACVAAAKAIRARGP